ncbi:MFS transporter [Flexivirga caeni]|uniref:MFS transporter n=1 Tax=Flexivirga caeni TaxID=2294115 RepID=A0A3M9M731_9MICO|nr:MFS transporter [Flexivirga caeni]RNI21306.1 MFS transporter [Flexivirga caeni]
MTDRSRTRLSTDFRWLAAGQGLSWLGGAFQPIALSVGILLHGGSVGELGALMAVLMVANTVCTLAGGVWSDRLSPRLVMLWSDAVRAATTAGMGVLFASGHASFLTLAPLAAVSGAAGAFFQPAMQSLKPVLVAASQRQRANALLSVLQGTSLVIGPALAGVVVGFVGAPAGFFVNAASFLISCGTVWRIRAIVVRKPRGASFLAELREGWSAVRERDWLVVGIVAASVYHVANGVLLVLVQVVAIRDLGGAHAFGMIAAAEGAGGLIGSAVAIRARPRHPLRIGWLTCALMPVWAAGYVWPGRLDTVIVTGLIAYGGLMFFSVMWETAIQDHVPHQLLGRVASWDMLVSFVGMPLGNALAGPLAEWFGIKPLMLGCAAVLACCALAPLAWRDSRNVRRAGPVADASVQATESARHT